MTRLVSLADQIAHVEQSLERARSYQRRFGLLACLRASTEREIEVLTATMASLRGLQKLEGVVDDAEAALSREYMLRTHLEHGLDGVDLHRTYPVANTAGRGR